MAERTRAKAIDAVLKAARVIRSEFVEEPIGGDHKEWSYPAGPAWLGTQEQYEAFIDALDAYDALEGDPV